MVQNSKFDKAANYKAGRSALLSGSALTGGILALMVVAGPQSAHADCAVPAVNTVNCNAATATQDDTNPDPAAATTTDKREQKFTTGGNVAVTISQPITKNGLAITDTEAGAAVNITNDGTISLNANPTKGGSAALNITTKGGDIIYTGKGSISSTGAPMPVSSVEMNAGGGNIGMTTGSGATVTGGFNGIILRTTNSGNIKLDTTGGLVTATNGGGITVSSADGSISVTTAAVNGGITAVAEKGDIKVVTNGAIDGATGIGILAGKMTTLGNVSVTANDTVFGGTSGIFAVTDKGNVDVRANKLVTGNTSDGIIATAGDGPGNISVTTGAVTGRINGINAISIKGATGDVTVMTTGSVVGTGGAGIIAGGDTTGNVRVSTNAAVGGNFGIAASAIGAGKVIVDSQGGAVTAMAGDGVFAHALGGTVSVTTADVTGSRGIFAEVNGTNNVTVNTTAGTVTGTNDDGMFVLAGGNVSITTASVTSAGVGKSGIDAISAGKGIMIVNVNQGATVTNAVGIGITFQTIGGLKTGSGSATLNNDGTINGDGTTKTNPVIHVVNNDSLTNVVTINNSATGTISNVAGTVADKAKGWAVVTDTDIKNFVGVQPVIINNDGLINGRVTLGQGQDQFNNAATGVWNVSGGSGADKADASQFGNDSTIKNAAGGIINVGSVATDTTNFSFNLDKAGVAAGMLNNSGLIDTVGTVNFFGLTSFTNTATYNVGKTTGDASSSTFMTGATAATSVGVQTVTNTGTFNVLGIGAQPGALNFYGSVGNATASNFNNAGLINMQADGGYTKNAVTFNTTALGGTSDLNYTYTWSGPLASNTYNFNGGANSRLAVDAFLGGPGSASDRLVVGGNVTGTTYIKVNDTNTGAGAFNSTGITLVAVQGSGSNNFKIDPTTANYVNFGPLGAIEKGFFISPLLYVVGGATSTFGPNGNAYKLFIGGLPQPVAFNMPVAHTGAHAIFSETGDLWEDRQMEIRSEWSHGFDAARQAGGSGADLALKAKAPPLAPPPESYTGIWTKMSGSFTDRRVTADLGTLNPLFTVLNYDNSYSQRTGAIISGFDFGRTELTSPMDSIVFSVMGGYISSFLDFNSPNTLSGTTKTSFSYTGGTVGGSVSYMNYGFYVDALLKADLLDLHIGGIPASFCGGAGGLVCGQSVSSTTYGVIGDIGYRFEFGRYFFEPLGNVIWSRNIIGDMDLPGAGLLVNFGSSDSLDVAAGFRTGGIVMDDRVHYVEASLTARVWDHVHGNSPVNFVNSGPTFTLHDDMQKVYAETALQLNWFSRGSGWSAFTKADAKFNNDFQTYSGKVGLRYGF